MSKSVQQKSRSGALLNTKKVQVVVTRADGSSFALSPHKQLRDVCLEDFKTLPSGVEFIS